MAVPLFLCFIIIIIIVWACLLTFAIAISVRRYLSTIQTIRTNSLYPHLNLLLFVSDIYMRFSLYFCCFCCFLSFCFLVGWLVCVLMFVIHCIWIIFVGYCDVRYIHVRFNHYECMLMVILGFTEKMNMTTTTAKKRERKNHNGNTICVCCMNVWSCVSSTSEVCLQNNNSRQHTIVKNTKESERGIWIAKMTYKQRKNCTTTMSKTKPISIWSISYFNKFAFE